MIRKSHLKQTLPTLTVCLLTLLAGSQLVANEEKIVTIEGKIEVAAYDDDGAIESVAVYDRAWGEVLIANDGVGMQLLDHVGDFAEITGSIVEIDEGTEGFSYRITVTTYTVEESEDPEIDEDWDPENPE